MNGWTGVANPTQVSPRTDYNNVSVGYAHACFWATPAPSTGSSLDCYGLNPHGEAGKDPTKYPTVPFTMPTYVYVSNAGADVSGQYTCANQVYGDLQCFGNNSEGQLGSTFYVSLGQNTGIPQLVGNGSLPHGLHQVATGRVHACAIDQGNVAFCWGYNGYGEIGNGALLNIFTLPQQVQTTHTFSALAAGLAHSCGIADDGHVYCWGGNFYGQLGNANTSVNSTAPILVSGT
jgi:alpha-tubulin suppressor-like RCC1 family protein